jgi:methyl-accepting chemotaxis protein
VLQMRRHEKDFMLRHDKKSADAFAGIADQFAMNLDISGLDDALTAALKQGFELYRAKFTELTVTQFEIDQVSATMQQHADAIDPILARMLEAADVLQKSIEAQAESERKRAQWIVVGMLIGVASVLVVLFIWITRRVAPPLAKAAQYCAEIAEGDLRRSIEAGRRDEIGDLLSSLAGMSAKLR